MSYIPSKTKKDVLAELITVLLIVVLSVATKAWGGEFNKPLFDSQVKSVHLQEQSVQDAYNSITNVRAKFDEFVDCDECLSSFIDKICENYVGERMFKLLLAHAELRKRRGEPHKLRILARESGDNEYDADTMEVHINTTLYDPDTWVQRATFCGLDPETRVISEKRMDLTDTLFHELCHAFHHLSGRLRTHTREALEHMYESDDEHDFSPTSYIWAKRHSKKRDHDEEHYNILGYYMEGGELEVDPISCFTFEFAKSIALHRPFIPRVFHCDYKGWLETRSEGQPPRTIISPTHRWVEIVLEEGTAFEARIKLDIPMHIVQA